MNHFGFGVIGFLFVLCFLGICIYISVFHFQKLTVSNSYSKNSYTVSSGGIGKMGNDYSYIVHDSIHEYRDLEFKLEQYAKEYVSQNSIISENKIIITLQTMQEKKIVGTIRDSKQSICKGYVIYNSERKTYMPYLKCGSYHSIDYLDYLE